MCNATIHHHVRSSRAEGPHTIAEAKLHACVLSRHIFQAMQSTVYLLTQKSGRCKANIMERDDFAVAVV